MIENGFSEQLDAYEKELEVEATTATHPQAYRATCFVKAEKKEEAKPAKKNNKGRH